MSPVALHQVARGPSLLVCHIKISFMARTWVENYSISAAAHIDRHEFSGTISYPIS
jgi:hypothetical protein